MSTEQAPVANPEIPGGNPEQQVSYESYRKVLDEKKAIQRRAEEDARKRAELEAEAESAKREKLEAQGKLSELKDLLDKENKQLKEKLEKETKSFAWKAVSGTLKAKAANFGCLDPDALLTVATSRKELNVKVSPEYEVDGESADEFFKEAKVKYPYLFKEKIVQTNDVNPTPTTQTTASKGLDSLSKDEIISRLRKL